MAMNVARAQSQARSLESCASDLSRAVNQLRTYRNMIIANYQSNEVATIVSEIDDIIRKLNRAMSEASSVGASINAVAHRIREQELARIRAAQRAVDNARYRLNSLNNQRRNLQNQISNTTDPNVLNELTTRMTNLLNQIRYAQNNYNNCVSELQAAQR